MHIRSSCVVHLGGVDYWVRDRVEHRLEISVGTTDILPAVAVHASGESLTLDYLKEKLRGFANVDDVFTSAFTQGGVVIVQTVAGKAENAKVEPDAQQYLESLSTRFVFEPNTGAILLPEGPYFVKNDCIHQAWRLYEDTFESFISATVPAANPEDGFENLRAAAYASLHPLIAVPSRLGYITNPQKSLNGMRISIKDLFHLKGIRTTLGSKAFTECYGPQEHTSAFVQRLIDHGAVIVGKTKMSAFAGSEVPPEKCIDYFPPWNPRADGYQGPSGSSSGAGASVAGYDWLDGSIATDTTGSLRMPASAYGLWGVRTTVNSASFDNIVPCVQMWDAVGVLGRNPRILSSVMNASFGSGDRQEKFKTPKSILYPTDWLPRPDKTQQRMTDQFLELLEISLGIKHTKISVSELWKSKPPLEAQGKSIEDYLVMSWYYPMYYDAYHNMDQFRADYHEKFGKDPYISPAQRDRWTKGQETTPEQREQAFQELKVFRRWIDENVFPREVGFSSGVIMLLPLGRAGPNYRDTLPQPSTSPPTVAELTAYDPGLFASMIGFPQIVVPIGQSQFTSRNSGQKCYVPIVGSLVGSPGTDLKLVEIVAKAMEKAHWPLNVLTGPLTFSIDDNDRNAGHSGVQLERNSSQRVQRWQEISHSNL
ncbi:amidase signature enzyme [Stipitochalara longipes BDJ]|nr:amidase signature enzyme [Stipitochalara longipes BDJ]